MGSFQECLAVDMARVYIGRGEWRRGQEVKPRWDQQNSLQYAAELKLHSVAKVECWYMASSHVREVILTMWRTDLRGQNQSVREQVQNCYNSSVQRMMRALNQGIRKEIIKSVQELVRG